jgi:hypothetical protein
MSYMSSADMAVLQPSVPSRASRPATLNIGASPIGPVLEIVLMVVTNAALSLVFCTAIAGAILR